jgi:WD40 repeat protein/serine/threonine protein kinase
MDPNHNLLFALAAVAAGKVSPGQLAAAARIGGAGDAANLGERLTVAGFLTAAEREAVGAAVERELSLRGGNELAAFASLWRAASVSPTFADPLSEAGGVPGTPSGPPMPAVLEADTPEPADRQEEAAAADDILAVCEHEGRYREICNCAKDGVGGILPVHDTHIGRDVALRQLPPELGGMPPEDPMTVSLLARFLQVARVTGQLEHPSIVPVYELGCRADGSMYYTMRLVKGRSLEEEIAVRATLTERLGLLTHFLDLCQAVAYAHSRGVIHRAINPRNVIIGAFGETVVNDWGVARVRGMQDIHAGELREAVNRMRAADAAVETDDGQTPDPPYCMSPEQAAGDPEAMDERSDIYSLGAVLYTILTGKPPYHGLTARAFLEHVPVFLPKPARQLEPRALEELAALCARAMAPDPEKRYASARELAAEMRRYLSGGFVSAYEYHFSELAHRFVDRHRRALIMATVAAIALLALDVYACVRVYRERNVARSQARIAVEERACAVAARNLAEQARAAAESARTAADWERGRSEHELYYANMAMAQRSIQESRMGQTRALLDAAPVNLRDWEWRHLVREANADSMALRTGGVFAAFCDGGRQLVTARPNGMVVASDLATGETVRTFVESGGAGSVAAVDAAGARLAVSSAKAVVVWSLADGRELLRFDEPGDALTRNFLSLSADGRRVAALNTDRTLRVWDVDTGAVVFERAARSQQGFDVWLSPKGDQMLLAGAELGDAGLVRAVTLLDLPSGRKAGQSNLGDVVSVHGAAFSPDGARVALALDNTAQVWDTKEWRQIREIAGRFAHPDTLAFSPDGAMLAAGTMDGDVILWDRTNDREQRLSRAHVEAVRRVAFRPDGRWLATAGVDRVARIWECPALQPVRALHGHDRPLLSLAFNPAGDRLVTGSFDGTSRVWDLTRELQYVTPAAVAVSGAAGIIAGAVDGGIALWSAETGARTSTLDTAGARVRILAFDRAGARLAAAVETGPRDRALLLWNVADGAVAARIPLSAEANRVDFTGAQDQFIAVRSGSWLDVHDAASGAAVWKLAGVMDLAFRGDGNQLAVCTLPEDPMLMQKQQDVALYDTAAWTKAAQFSVPTSFTAALTWSPDHKRLALGAQVLSDKEWRGGAYLWNLDRPGTPQWLQGHDSLVCAIAFDPSGERIATGGKDGRLVLWQVDSGTEQWRAPAHGGDIQDVAFSPEGTRLATAGRDGAFKLWDADDGREVLTLPTVSTTGGGEAVPAEVCFDPRGRYLLTITEPSVLPPLFHWAVPAPLAQPSETPLQERIEAWKRTGK